MVHRHLRENTPLVASLHGKVVPVAYATLALEAQDPGVQLQLQRTADLAQRCRPIRPASGLRLPDYPLAWRRWQAAGWDI